MNGSFVIPLKEAKNLQLVGGKARALGQMIRGGFNVPDGFVITTKVFESKDKKLTDEILKWFDKLGVEFVAVRSSAVAEDGLRAAWAGQMDSYLNINRDKLFEHVQKCWKSAGSERAKAYAIQRSLTTGPLAVIIQKMINGQISGVAFSAHPITKNPTHIVIEAVHGLAEKLVSGHVTPDNYVIDKGSFQVIQSLLTDKAPKLAEEKIKELSEIIQKLEQHFNYPVDVEWTLHNSKFHILQSRPITTLE